MCKKFVKLNSISLPLSSVEHRAVAIKAGIAVTMKADAFHRCGGYRERLSALDENSVEGSIQTYESGRFRITCADRASFLFMVSTQNR